MPEFTIRLATPDDRGAVYEICLRTGDLGADATGMYDDPDVLGHVYAGPYLALEPEFALVVTDEHGVEGYTLGALDTSRFVAAWRERWLPQIASRYPPPSGEATTPDERARYALHFPERLCRTDVVSAYPSHLHIDLLPRARGRGWGRRLVTALFDRLRDAGSPGVHLNVHPENARAVAFYRRVGFTELEAGPGGLMGRRLDAC